MSQIRFLIQMYFPYWTLHTELRHKMAQYNLLIFNNIFLQMRPLRSIKEGYEMAFIHFFFLHTGPYTLERDKKVCKLSVPAYCM